MTAKLVVQSILIGALCAWMVASEPPQGWRGAGAASLRLASPVGQGTDTRVHLPAILRMGGRVYWGALVGRAAPPTSENLAPGGTLAAFEALTGKGMAILHWGQPWVMDGSAQSFQTDYFDRARAHGSIPLLDWSSWSLGAGIDQPDYRLAVIASGVHDTYVRQWARDAAAWGHPFFLRFNWEMNGNWQFSWSEQLNGNARGDYVRAWRHVHDLFEAEGATNVTWVWCPNISGPTTLPLVGLYPGDAYVDWTCLDGYNKYDSWQPFDAIFSGRGITWLYDSYQEVLTVAPSKPIMIGETASLEGGDGGTLKAQWITDAFLTQIPHKYPRIKAVVWFNWDGGNPTYVSLPVESSTASLEAMRTALSQGPYAGNEFSQLAESPIPALP